MAAAILRFTFGFAPHELRDVGRLVSEHRGRLLEAWHGYFGTER